MLTHTKLKLLLVVLFAFILSACGGGDGANDNQGITRVLFDAPVNGVSYTCDNGASAGLTQNGGEFICQAAPATFSIGTLELGTVNTFADDNRVFPQDLAGTTRDDFTGKAVLIARLLQSLDTNDDADIISIPQGIFAETGLSIDNENDLAGLVATVQSATLIPADQAISNLRGNMYSVIINVANANPSGAINTPVTLTFSGAMVINNQGARINQMTLASGDTKTVSVFLIDEPSANNQELRIITQANGFSDSGGVALLETDEALYEVNINLTSTSDGQAAAGVMVSNMDVNNNVADTGIVSEAIVVSNQAASSTLRVTIPANTMLTDAVGNPVSATNLRVTNFNPTEQQALDAYPGGLDVMAQVDGLVMNGQTQTGEAQISFKSAAFAAITLQDDNGNKVRNFSQPVEVAMQFPIGTTDGEGVVVRIDDEVPIWSYDEDTGRWTYEAQGIVTDRNTSDDLYDVVYSVTHLSYYNLDWFITGSCDFTIFNFRDALDGIDYTPYNTTLLVDGIADANRWSREDRRAFVLIQNAPPFSGSLDVLQRNADGSDGAPVLAAPVTFSNLCAPTNRDIVIRLAERDVDAGADRTISSDVGSSITAQVATYDSACNSTITYDSSNPAVATNPNTSTITIAGAGTTTITASAAETNQCEASSDSYLLTLNLNPVLNASVTATVDEDNSATFAVSVNASDTVGDNLTWSLLTAAGNGLASVSGSGTAPTITYAPNSNYSGTDSFTAQVADGNGGSAQIVINVTVAAINDTPTFTSSPLTTATEDSAYSYTATATDVDGDNLTFSATTIPSWLSLNGAILSGTPTNENVGTHSVTLSVVDDGSPNLSAQQTFIITVANTNDAPVIAQGDNVSVNMSEDGSPTAFIAPTLTASDVDVGAVLNWSLASVASNGNASVSGTGTTPTITYAPSLNDNGTDSFVVQVTDNDGAIDTIVIDITIAAVNDAPTINGNSLITTATTGTLYTAFSQLPIASDVDGDTLTFSIQNTPSWANFDSTTGQLSGTPAQADVGDFGNIIISVRDRDSGGLSTSLPAFSITVSDIPPTGALWNQFNWNDGDTWQ